MTFALQSHDFGGRLGSIGCLGSIQSNEFFAKSIDPHPVKHATQDHPTQDHPTQDQPTQGPATQGRPSPGAKQ
jgi:hypothetical protein